MYMNQRLKGGFTLIELLVVISIIALLSSVVLASLNSARLKARDAQRLLDMRNFKNALEVYALNNNGSYPNFNGLGSCAVAGWGIVDWNTTGFAAAMQPYLSVLPKGPSMNCSTFSDSYYYNTTGGKDYKLTLHNTETYRNPGDPFYEAHNCDNVHPCNNWAVYSDPVANALY